MTTKCYSFSFLPSLFSRFFILSGSVRNYTTQQKQTGREVFIKRKKDREKKNTKDQPTVLRFGSRLLNMNIGKKGIKKKTIKKKTHISPFAKAVV